MFGTARSLSKKGCPFDNAVDESTNKSLKAELVWGRGVQRPKRAPVGCGGSGLESALVRKSLAYQSGAGDLCEEDASFWSAMHKIAMARHH